MYKRNDGKGINAVQNRFTAMLKKSLRNRRIDYMIQHNKKCGKKVYLEDCFTLPLEESDFMQTVIDCDTVRSALRTLTEKERKIIIAHIIEDKDFVEIGKAYGLSYKGTATAFYRAINKLREMLRRYRDEF